MRPEGRGHDLSAKNHQHFGRDAIPTHSRENTAVPGLPRRMPMQPRETRPVLPSADCAENAAPVVLAERTQLFLNWFMDVNHCAHCDLYPRRYAERQLVASGGMSSVYRLQDRRLNRTLAMKVSSLTVGRDLSGMKTDHMRSLCRFLEEAQIHAQLDHPGIVPLYDLGLDTEDHPFFTMRFVEGVSFETMIAGLHSGVGGWTLRSALRALVLACKPIAYAHSRGVFHRDLKPANMMIGPHGEVFVIDWGLACASGAGARPGMPGCERECPGVLRDLHTPPGNVVGTPMYMAPEQACALPAGPAADIYSLGAILYCLLTGRRPFDDTHPLKQCTVLLELMEHAPRSIETIRPELPPELVAICWRAMERDASRRYPDVLSLAADLTRFLERGERLPARASLASRIREWLLCKHSPRSAAG